MGDSLIKIGLTGLKAHQTALSTTGNNVTNANTPGYSRQRVTFDTNPTLNSAGGYMGTGVNISNIERLNSHFINSQLRLDSSAFSEYTSLLGYLSQVDGLMADSSTGMAPALNNFFKSLHTAADDPSSIPARTLLISEAEGLVNRFKSLHNQLTQIGTSVNQEMSTLVPQINTLSQSIAELNVAIVAAGGGTPHQQPNDLLDKRDELVRQLSELVSVSVVDPGDGTISVFVGKGQPLVMADRANSLEVVPSASDRTHMEIALKQNHVSSIVTSEISGGKLGGVLAFRDSVLQESINSLGRIALNIASAVNEQHQLGVDLEGQLGGTFFSDFNSAAAQSSRVIPNRNNPSSPSATLGVEILDASALTTQEYEVRFTSAATFEVVTGNGSVVTTASVPSPLGPDGAIVSFDGISVNLQAGAFQAGDRFTLTPTRYGARDIGLDIRRPEDVALGFPIRAEAKSANTGAAVITQGTMLGIRGDDGELISVRDNAVPTPNVISPFSNSANGQLSPPLLIRFTADNEYVILDNSDPANPVPLSLDPPLDPQTFTPGVRADVFSTDPGDAVYTASNQRLFLGFQFSITGVPRSGDEFVISYNASGVSDNRNALALAGLESATKMGGGKLSFNGAYSQVVQTIGVQTSQARTNMETSQSLLRQSEGRWQSMSGVNLDEEAGKLIQFQAAYNASAKVMGVARELFDTLISTFR